MVRFSLAGRSACVTGASDGLGWQCADALAAAGAFRTVCAVIAHTADRDAWIVIISGGAIGLLRALVLRVYGHSHIRITEPNALGRDLLDAIDSDEAFDPVAAPAEDASAVIAIDAVGSGITRAAGSAIVRPGGIMVHVGLQTGAQAFVDIHQGKAPPKIFLVTGSG